MGMRRFRKQIARIMVAVTISTLLSSAFGSVAYANELPEQNTETVAPAGEIGSTEDYSDIDEGTDVTLPDVGDEETGDVSEDNDIQDDSDIQDADTEDNTDDADDADAENTDDAEDAEEDDADAADTEDSEDADTDDADTEDSEEADTEDADAEDDADDEEQSEEEIEDAEETDETVEVEPEGKQKLKGKTVPGDTVATVTGWVEKDGHWMYIRKSGNPYVNCVKKLDGAYYGFDENGYRYENQNFFMSVNQGDGVYVSREYRAKEDGKLYVNEWYVVSDYWSCRYYGADGAAYVDGVYTVNAISFYFDQEGCFLYYTYGSSYEHADRAISWNGKNYIVEDTGVATELVGNGWHEFNGRKYYISSGEFLRERVKMIDRVLYLFTYDGYMLDDDTYSFYSYDESTQSYCSDTYSAKKGGVLYVSEWCTNKYGVTLYHGSDGRAYQNGIYIIGEKQYYFDGTALAKNKVITYDQKTYFADANGILTPIKKDGWFTAENGDKYYIENGVMLTDCVKFFKETDQYFGFGYDGKMYKNTVFYAPDDPTYATTSAGHFYRAEADGHLLCNSWFTDDSYANRTIYYFGNDARALDYGVRVVDNVRYFFGYNGYLLQNDLLEYSSKLYLVDDNGRAYQVSSGCGWVETSAGKYFINNSGIVKARGNAVTYQINGETYIFLNNGLLFTDGLIVADNKTYICDSNGVAVLATKEGWNTFGDRTYYLKDGWLLCAGIYEIDGVKYAFDKNGLLIKGISFEGTNWAYSSNSFNPYQAKNDGVLYRNEWLHENADDYYFDDDCIRVRGFNKISGKTYYMDDFGRKQTGFISVDGNKYYLNSSGVLQKSKWIKYDKTHWFYAKSDGVLATGWKSIDGYRYYFKKNCVMSMNAWISDGGKKYHTDSVGHLMLGFHVIDKKGYYFDLRTGVMVTNCFIKMDDGKYYYFGKDGVLQKNRWITVGGKRYHLSSKGYRQTGWFKDGTKYYYLDSKGRMVTGTVKIGSRTYKFAATGVCKNR